MGYAVTCCLGLSLIASGEVEQRCHRAVVADISGQPPTALDALKKFCLVHGSFSARAAQLFQTQKPFSNRSLVSSTDRGVGAAHRVGSVASRTTDSMDDGTLGESRRIFGSGATLTEMLMSTRDACATLSRHSLFPAGMAACAWTKRVGEGRRRGTTRRRSFHFRLQQVTKCPAPSRGPGSSVPRV